MTTNYHTAVATGAAANAATINGPLGQLDAEIAAVNARATAAAGGSTVTNARLIEWASGEDYEVTAVNYDTDGVVTTATVKWPDGSGGTFTTTTKNSTWLAVDAYTVTHTASSKTVTQAAVTRNADGAVTAKPAMTVA